MTVLDGVVRGKIASTDQLGRSADGWGGLWWEPQEKLLVYHTSQEGTVCIHPGTVKHYKSRNAALDRLCDFLGIFESEEEECREREPLTEHWSYGPKLLWHRLQNQAPSSIDLVILDRLEKLSYACDGYRVLESDWLRDCLCYDPKNDSTSRPQSFGREKERCEVEARQRKSNRNSEAVRCLACRCNQENARNHMVVCANAHGSEGCGGAYHQRCLRPMLTRLLPSEEKWLCWQCRPHEGWKMTLRCPTCLVTGPGLVMENGNRRQCGRCGKLHLIRAMVPEPSFRNIPREFRGIDRDFVVRQSARGNGKAGLGVFCRNHIRVGTTLLYTGDIIYDWTDRDESANFLFWDQYWPSGVMGTDKDLVVRVNEPDATGQKANCCFSSDEWGLYLVVCRDLEPGTELLVHYGLNYHPNEGDDDEDLGYEPPGLDQDLTVEEKNNVLAMLGLPLVMLPIKLYH